MQYRITTNSSNNEIFDEAKGKYVKSLEESKHKVSIEYMKNKTT